MFFSCHTLYYHSSHYKETSPGSVCSSNFVCLKVLNSTWFHRIDVKSVDMVRHSTNIFISCLEYNNVVFIYVENLKNLCLFRNASYYSFVGRLPLRLNVLLHCIASKVCSVISIKIMVFCTTEKIPSSSLVPCTSLLQP